MTSYKTFYTITNGYTIKGKQNFNWNIFEIRIFKKIFSCKYLVEHVEHNYFKRHYYK